MKTMHWRAEYRTPNLFPGSVPEAFRERSVPSTKLPPLPKGRGTTEGGGGIYNTYHYNEKVKLKYKIRTQRTDRRKLPFVIIPNNEVNRNYVGVCRYIDNAAYESLRQSTTDTSL